MLSLSPFTFLIELQWRDIFLANDNLLRIHTRSKTSQNVETLSDLCNRCLPLAEWWVLAYCMKMRPQAYFLILTTCADQETYTLHKIASKSKRNLLQLKPLDESMKYMEATFYCNGKLCEVTSSSLKITNPCWPHAADNPSFTHEHQHHHNARDNSNKHMKDTLRSRSLFGIHELVVDWGHFAGRHSPSHPHTA